MRRRTEGKNADSDENRGFVVGNKKGRLLLLQLLVFLVMAIMNVFYNAEMFTRLRVPHSSSNDTHETSHVLSSNNSHPDSPDLTWLILLIKHLADSKWIGPTEGASAEKILGWPAQEKDNSAPVLTSQPMVSMIRLIRHDWFSWPNRLQI